MKLVTNSVAPTQVQETDTAFIIQDVPFVKPMRLAGGYVPRANIKATVDEWDGVPATLNHPRGENGEPVAATQKPETHIGRVDDVYFDGEYARGDITLPKSELSEGEAQDIKTALENGEQIDVSSQYAAQPLEPGEYDGEYRDNVEEITRPDSVAILPNQPGQCSIEDGCGINPQMVANSELSIPIQANAHSDFSEGDVVGWQSSGGQAMGVIRELRGEDSDDAFDEEIDGDVSVSPPAALIEVVEETDDGLVPTGTIVGHKTDTDTLSTVSDPPELVSNTVNRVLEALKRLLSADDAVSPETGRAEGMAVDMEANQMEFALTDITPDDVDSYTDDSWDGDAATAAMPNPSESDDAAAALDASHLIHPTTDEDRESKANWKLPFREGPDAPVNTRGLVAAIAAINGARGGVDAPQEDLEGAEARARDFLVDAPDNLFGSMDSEDEDVAGNPHSEQEDMSDNMTEKTAELVANHGFKEDNLPPESTECFDRIYTAVTSNDSGVDDTMSENTDKVGLDDLTDDAQEALIEQAAERIEANRKESEKDDLAEDIVANSNEYEDTESVKEDFPTVAALETKKTQVTSTGATPSAGATRGEVSANSDELGVWDDVDMEIGAGGEF